MLGQNLKVLFVSLAVLVSIASPTSGLEPNWSVCANNFIGNCINGVASDDGTFAWLRPNGVSVRGLFVFFVIGLHGGSPGLAEFVFQERVGNYTLLTEAAGRSISLKRMGGVDPRTPALTMVNELSLISDGASRFFESAGSANNCLTERYAFKSLAINGPERWELFGRNGRSVCIQLENTASPIPGIVRDIGTLGFDHRLRNVCRIVRGCSKPVGEVIRIKNVETQGVLRRLRVD